MAKVWAIYDSQDNFVGTGDDNEVSKYSDKISVYIKQIETLKHKIGEQILWGNEIESLRLKEELLAVEIESRNYERKFSVRAYVANYLPIELIPKLSLVEMIKATLEVLGEELNNAEDDFSKNRWGEKTNHWSALLDEAEKREITRLMNSSHETRKCVVYNLDDVFILRATSRFVESESYSSEKYRIYVDELHDFDHSTHSLVEMLEKSLEKHVSQYEEALSDFSGYTSDDGHLFAEANLRYRKEIEMAMTREDQRRLAERQARLEYQCPSSHCEGFPFWFRFLDVWQCSECGLQVRSLEDFI